MLASIAKALRKKHSNIDIFIDGGIRYGSDVLKCLAFGARMIFLGRPIVWGLYFQGVDGIRQVMTMINEELKVGMCLTGCMSVGEVKEDRVIEKIRYKL